MALMLSAWLTWGGVPDVMSTNCRPRGRRTALAPRERTASDRSRRKRYRPGEREKTKWAVPSIGPVRRGEGEQGN